MISSSSAITPFTFFSSSASLLSSPSSSSSSSSLIYILTLVFISFHFVYAQRNEHCVQFGTTRACRIPNSFTNDPVIFEVGTETQLKNAKNGRRRQDKALSSPSSSEDAQHYKQTPPSSISFSNYVESRYADTLTRQRHALHIPKQKLKNVIENLVDLSDSVDNILVTPTPTPTTTTITKTATKTYSDSDESKKQKPRIGRQRNIRRSQAKFRDGRSHNNDGSRIVRTANGKFDARIVGSSTLAYRQAISQCMEEASVWWPSTITVDVLVNFSSVGGPRVLGSARPTSTWEINDIIYPVALAEALSNRTLNKGADSDAALSERFDVYMTLNSDAQWHTSVMDTSQPDGMTYDLITVCLHELIHGLFMSGGNLVIRQNENAEDESSLYSASMFNPQYVGRFDAFMSDSDGCSVIQGYKNTPKYLGAALTGNNLWFADPSGKVFARLHAPRPYIPGSSLYHLSEATYGAGGEGNDLMTPVIGSSYKQHDIGPVVREMLSLLFDNNITGAKICPDMGPPVVDDSFVDGGGGSGGTDGGDSGGSYTGGVNQQNGFYIKLGTVQISGWIIIGIAVGLVVIIFTSAFVVRAVIVSSSKRRMPPRLVSRPDRIEMTTNGNTTGMV